MKPINTLNIEIYLHYIQYCFHNTENATLLNYKDQ
jgi:hypothetical protein